MEHVKDLIPAPESLMVSGCSGGAFGAALLTDDVMEIYPDCDEVACLVDSGVWFQKWLSGTMDKIKITIPNAGIYIFDIPDTQTKPYHLTIHCIIGDRHLYQNRTDGKTCMEWIRDAVRGQITSCGLSLLGVK